MKLRLGWLAAALLLPAVGIAVFFDVFDLRERRARDAILGSDPARIERLGRRLIVGYKDIAKAKALVEKRAIAGLFINARNVEGRTAGQIRLEIDSLQAIRQAQGLPRLIIAADQEGGIVSRLSPPLKYQPSLASVIARLQSDGERERAVREYASTQALGLVTLGVTMNFSPVVDLLPSPSHADDNGSRISLRAIASDPERVAQVAGWYCATLAQHDITCTLKHFPGLGRVANDTHVSTGEIAASEAELEHQDWLPFRRLMTDRRFAVMVGHVRINAIDQAAPSSYSSPVIGGLLRSRWNADSLIVTDDFGMGAVLESGDGIGGAAVKALNAGVDLVLLSNSDKHFNTVMSALVQADRAGLIRKDVEAESYRRLMRATAGQHSAM